MTGKSIAILDPDPRYSKALSERLHYYLPDAKISRYSPSTVIEDKKELREEIILYDNNILRPELITESTSAAFLPILIPLRSEHRTGDCRISGKHLSEQIASANTSVSDQCFHSQTASGKSGVLRLFLSLGSRPAREKYIRANTGTLLSSGDRLIRLDIMPGILVSEAKSSSLLRRNGNQICSGYSDLLLHLGDSELKPEILLDYLRPNGSGWMYFGRPSRSDDIISLDLNLLVRLVQMLRSLVDNATPSTSAIVVVDGLSLSKVKRICPLAHEMHVIFPEDASNDDPLIHYEIEQLFSASGPKQLKFISTESREVI
ncbi:MAG: hypothetical protein JW780_00585 [Clostridiales bacterium]|nr:hypothetical protein [Clostridiales bacterium]